jgi:hypothetical protein
VGDEALIDAGAMALTKLILASMRFMPVSTLYVALEDEVGKPVLLGGNLEPCVTIHAMQDHASRLEISGFWRNRITAARAICIGQL